MIADTSAIRHGLNDFLGILKFHRAEAAGVNLIMIGSVANVFLISARMNCC
jgi:hypothetical protein